MVELIIDGNNTIRSKNEIYREFVKTKIYNFVKAEFSSNSRQDIEEWLKENYEFLCETDYEKIADFIACKI